MDRLTKLVKRKAGLVTAFSTLLATLASPLSAAPVQGEVTEFRSPSGLTEQCVRITPFPAARYSKRDLEEEAAYCRLDLEQLALCPKLWSTSPGTVLYEIDLASSGGDISAWEQQHCGSGHHAKGFAQDKPATFKISVNDRETSATYAPSSWVYYHLSRYFNTATQVPVAVYRSVDARMHHQRVVKPALGYTAGHRNLRMLAAGWRFLDEVETGGGPAGAGNAALTDGGRQVYGVLLNNKGDRYGPEINGTRESGWGVGQNLDFQQTAAFRALRNPAPVEEAARQSIHDARSNPRMATKLPADTPVIQVVFWMREVLEIALLDYLLGQQDRIGNIDYTWRWYWLEEGKLKSDPAHGHDVPDKLAPFNPVRLRRSAINDNDAGVRRGYANFAKNAGMLEGLRHYHAGTYYKLGALARDLAAKGAAWEWLTQPAGLSTKEAEAISARASEAFALLKSDCESGKLQLDLNPAAMLGALPAKATSCALPAE